MSLPPDTLTAFTRAAPRFLFFTGKGGVGKTTLACATAVALADSGRRVLLISTDPASNLDEVLGAALTSAPLRLPAAPTLWALNIDPETAAREYRERVLAPYRTTLPPALVASVEEQLSGACTTEIAAFNEFARYLGDPEATAAYDQVVFDTAPTGHTLRLLQLPAAWNQFLNTNTSGTSCLGPLAGLREQHALYLKTLECLGDAARTQVALVSRPEPTALAEAERTRVELGAVGLSNLRLLLNGLFDDADQDPLARALAARQRAALSRLPPGLRALPRTEIPLLALHLTGLAALRSVTSPERTMAAPPHAPPSPAAADWPPLAALLAELEAAGRGVILTMGKGGVGKTTLAAAIAVELAGRGHRVHLTTTDPAAHVATAVGEAVPGLSISRIDPVAETAAYARESMELAGADLDEDGRRLLAEDLRSPCTEEIAVFRAFAATVDRGQDGFVVLDTAPTGHTLLLLDATEAYHRQVQRTQSDLPAAVRQLLPRLRDPSFTKIILVTLPEATPVHEAAHLQDDLKRAGITPFAWVVNQSLAPLAVSHPLLRARQANEVRFIEEVRRLASRLAVVPWLAREPTGVDGLRQMTADPSPSPSRPRQRRPRILFLCTGNSCRSQMAEGWARHLKGDVLEAYSAGIETHGLNPSAVQVMAEAGVDISGQRSKCVDELADVAFDVVVTVCGHAHETCPTFFGAPRIMHVGFDDPPRLARNAGSAAAALDVYRRVRDEIRGFVETLPAALDGKVAAGSECGDRTS
jgi:arsenite-transporting ATPase